MSYLEDAYPEIPTSFDGLALVAVEFDAQPYRHEGLFDKPADGVVWTVKLGRLALCRDGTWAYWRRLRDDPSKSAEDEVRDQRFEHFEEAVRVATAALGAEPPHAQYMRTIYRR
jgi:hypothetical protein